MPTVGSSNHYVCNTLKVTFAGGHGKDNMPFATNKILAELYTATPHAAMPCHLPLPTNNASVGVGLTELKSSHDSMTCHSCEQAVHLTVHRMQVDRSVWMQCEHLHNKGESKHEEAHGCKAVAAGWLEEVLCMLHNGTLLITLGTKVHPTLHINPSCPAMQVLARLLS